ncbi:MAG: ABC transporter permease [Allosphingosinicella sp.]
MSRELWRAAARDASGGAAKTWLWAALAWSDIRQRYSGSVLGSLWITANIALLTACLTLVFSGPLRATHADYAPFVAIGLVLWNFIQATLGEAPGVFVASAETIRHSPLPLSIHVLRLVARNAIVLGHNAVIVPVVLILFGVEPGVGLLLVLLALPLLALSLVAAGFLLGLLGARFRDVPQIVGSSLQLLFFATPIVWPPVALGAGHGWIVAANPVFAFIDIVRAPLLGAAPASSSWPVALATTVIACALAAFAFARCRERVVYWV